jgi:hypothetical protein
MLRPVHLSGEREETDVTIDDTHTMTDDDLLAEARTECARWDGRDELEAGFARLFLLRDEALRRGLPLPMTCPLETPLTAGGEADSGIPA